MHQEPLPIARFGRPHGVRGEIRLWAYNAESPLYDDVIHGWVEAEEGRREIALVSVRWADRFGIARVEGVKWRDQAAELRNLELFIEREALPELEDDELYLVDTIGWPVWVELEGEAGERLGHIGQVKGYMDTGANAVMRVALQAGGSLLVPVLDFVVREMAPERARVVLAPIEQWAPEGTEVEHGRAARLEDLQAEEE